MKYLLSEEELQEFKDGLQNAKEDYQKICDRCAEQGGRLAKAKVQSRRIIANATKILNDATVTRSLGLLTGRKEAAELILECLTPTKEGDS